MQDKLNTPAGWVPPANREFVYADLTEADLKVLRVSMKVTDHDGNEVPLSDDDIRQQVRRVTGVRDKRTGVVHETAGVPYVQVETGGPGWQ